jgi:hypothetical protein
MEMEHLLQYLQNDRMVQCLPMVNLQGIKHLAEEVCGKELTT